jgi:exosome complex component RRP40
MSSEDATRAESLLVGVVKSAAWRPLAVFPGDDVTRVIQEFLGRDAEDEETPVARLGAGLQQDAARAAIICVKPGVLRFLMPGRFWVTTNGRRYVAETGDLVLGAIVERLGNHGYRVNIRGCGMATLKALAFDGASKRNHPDLAVGTLVYARVELASKHVDTELTCIADSGVKKDWMTGEAQFGKLVGGTTFECSHELARSLLQEDCPVLIALAGYIKFEIAVGYNGWVWVDSESPQHSIVVANACLNSEFMKKSGLQIVPMVEELVAAML